MKKTVFIDGSHGTTGLVLLNRLSGRSDICLTSLNGEDHRSEKKRAEMMSAVDLVFLCLPDEAAKQAVSLINNDSTRVIDASTAHRVSPGWAYGFSELSPAHRDAIAASKRIANPGCHASGFIAAVYPLIGAGVIGADAKLDVYSITGYSGGGKKMIGEYVSAQRDPSLDSPRQYAFAQSHKHLAEMAAICALDNAPVFCPVVCDFYSGMAVTLFLNSGVMKKSLTPGDLCSIYSAHYAGSPLISAAVADDGGFLAANALSGTDLMQIVCAGTPGRLTVTCLFDNLGKGAAGAAIQNMNIAIGADECASLVTERSGI